MNISLICLDPEVPFGGQKGPSIHLRSMAAALLRAEHDVVAQVVEAGPLEAQMPLRDKGLRIEVLPKQAAAGPIAERLKHARVDLAIERLSMLAPQGAEAATKAGIPHVYEAQALHHADTEPPGEADDVKKAEDCFRRGFQASSGVIAVSDEVARWASKLAPPKHPVRVVPNGVEEFFFQKPAAARVATAAGDLGPARGFRVGFVGNFRRSQDLEGLILAIEILRRQGVPAQLALVGDGPSRNALLRLACERGVPLALTGHVPHAHVPAYLANCDAVAVTCDKADGCDAPVTLFEAMASAVPVVATATGPCQRHVRNGVNGLLVPPREPIALAAAFSRLAADRGLGSRLGTAARVQARAHHTWDRAVAEMLRFAGQFAPRGVA